ncbi:MAG: phage holin family protein [Gammaproteobacteria bacterium]|nr:phage holin family protein [Gammaproteobacteria bacterium]
MRGFVLRLFVSVLGLWLASAIVPGLEIDASETLVLAALLLGIVNAFVRPIFIIMTLPITVLTLGFFLLIVNAAMLGLVAALLEGFVISGFFAALFGSLVISIVSWYSSLFIGSGGNIEHIVINKKDKF